MPPSADAALPSATLPLGRPHSIAEDFYALVIGCILLVIGLVFLKAAGLVTGGIAGIALLLSQAVVVGGLMMGLRRNPPIQTASPHPTVEILP